MRTLFFASVFVVAVTASGSVRAQDFLRGDTDSDGLVDAIVDANHHLATLYYIGQPAVPCPNASDANDDGGYDISDVVFLLDYGFVPGSSPPPAPGPLACGPDPTPGVLSCSTPPGCGPYLPPPADPDHLFTCDEVSIAPSGTASVTVRFDHQGTSDVNGVSFGLRHDPAILTLAAASIPESYVTYTNGGPNFESIVIHPDGVTMGAINSFLYTHPFAPGAVYELLDLEYTALSAGASDLEFAEDLGDPPVAVSVATLPAAFRIVPATLDGSVTVSVPEFSRADTNGDGVVDIADALSSLSSLFLPTGEPFACQDAADSNDDGTLNLGDPVHTLSFLFVGGPGPAAPFPSCGEDPTVDALSCDEYACP